jgi:hypothetical protein
VVFLDRGNVTGDFNLRDVTEDIRVLKIKTSFWGFQQAINAN